MHKVLITQATVVFGVVVAFAVAGRAPGAAGAAFGGGTALVNGFLLIWRHGRVGRPLHADPGRHVRSFFASAIERFVLVAVLLAVGIGPLQLDPLPLLAGFIGGQVALVLGLKGGIQ